jgi:phytoene dehydrogenase-like protein
MYDTIIIGAGMSGLAAGIRLAHFGRRVCILERHYTIGGLNSFYRLRGRDYDVGLHAVTNFVPKGSKIGPLPRLLRQLRFRWDDFALSPQLGSEIRFPDVRLRFNNGIEMLRAEVARAFPNQIDNFDRLLAKLPDYDEASGEGATASAREMVSGFIGEPLLVEMLFCPLMFYGSARENDMDWGQFAIMFRSIFMEGFARPYEGVRLILRRLVRRFRELGGELRLRAGVKRLEIAGQSVAGVELDDGSQIEGRQILSSAGWCETMRLCSQLPATATRPSGRLSFCETITALDVLPRDLDYERTITFFNDHDKFVWQKPDEFCDVRSGVICTPNNFAYDDPLAEGTMRVTVLADYDRWRSLDPERYQLEKRRWYDRITESAVRFVPDYRPHMVDTDMFTPTTVVHFTGHDNGAVYGAPDKKLDGTTHLDNLFVCGTDQGFVGIIGTITSGIAMANRHCLRS